MKGHGTDGGREGFCLGRAPLSWGSSDATYPISPILDSVLFFPKRSRTHLSISLSFLEQWDPRSPDGGRGRLRGHSP